MLNLKILFNYFSIIILSALSLILTATIYPSLTPQFHFSYFILVLLFLYLSQVCLHYSLLAYFYLLFIIFTIWY